LASQTIGPLTAMSVFFRSLITPEDTYFFPTI
jgi:hypothetical protein